MLHPHLSTNTSSATSCAASCTCSSSSAPRTSYRTVIGSFSFAAPTSDAKKDETALMAFLWEMDPVYTRNKHKESGAGSSGLTTTVYANIVINITALCARHPRKRSPIDRTDGGAR